jgi:hypothetical protein
MDKRSRERKAKLDKLTTDAARDRRVANQQQAAARGLARDNQRLAELAERRTRETLELQAANHEVHGDVPLSVDMGEPGDQSTLASQGAQPQLHQESQETTGDQFGDDSTDTEVGAEEPEEPVVPVFSYSEIGGVGEKSNTRVWVFKFGCMAFAATGGEASALELHRQLRRLFVEPAPLQLVCPKCNAVAPSAVVYYWHMLSGCADVNTPFQNLWHSCLPLFFLVTGDALKALTYAEQYQGRPVDLLDPRKMPSQVGPNVAHRSEGHRNELCKERSLMTHTKKRKKFWSVVQKKLTWMASLDNKRNEMVMNMPELLSFAFLKPTAEWPVGLLDAASQGISLGDWRNAV